MCALVVVRNSDMDTPSPTDDDNRLQIKQHRQQQRNKLHQAIASLRQEFGQKGLVFVLGLPPDTTLDEVVELFGKYGPLQQDSQHKRPRVKMYYDHDQFKGECTVFYDTVVSAAQAIELADGTTVRGHTIKVEEAIHRQKPVTPQFGGQPLTAAPPAEFGKPKVVLSSEEKLELERRKLLLKATSLRIDNMFRPLEFDKQLQEDIEADIVDECHRLGVENVTVAFDGTAVIVATPTAHDATTVLNKFHDRWYDGLKLSVSRIAPLPDKQDKQD